MCVDDAVVDDEYDDDEYDDAVKSEMTLYKP